MNDLDKLFEEITKKQKISINWKVLITIGVLVVLIYFLFTFSSISKQTKEINCITYYTSLGYTANGCEKIIERFIGDN